MPQEHAHLLHRRLTDLHSKSRQPCKHASGSDNKGQAECNSRYTRGGLLCTWAERQLSLLLGRKQHVTSQSRPGSSHVDKAMQAASGCFSRNRLFRDTCPPCEKPPIAMRSGGMPFAISSCTCVSVSPIQTSIDAQDALLGPCSDTQKQKVESAKVCFSHWVGLPRYAIASSTPLLSLRAVRLKSRSNHAGGTDSSSVADSRRQRQREGTPQDSQS